MTVRAIAGLFALNAAVGVVGVLVLWCLRGYRTWGDVARLAGLGYLMGVAGLGTVWTLMLVVGVPFGSFAIVLSFAGLAVAGLGVGLRRDMSRPHGGAGPTVVSSTLVAATGVALLGLYAEALFRAARLQSLQAFDAWAFWVAKAKAIYWFGGLDEQIFTTAAGPSYPPLVPALDAVAFHAMGSADPVTLHLQYWFLTVGIVAAIAGVLVAHAPAWIVWPVLGLLVVVPRFSERLLAPLADVLLDGLFVAAALLLSLWLRDGRGWRIAAATILLAGAALTKREGLVLSVCVVLVAVLAAALGRRPRWWLPIVCAGGVAAAVIPWRLWYGSRGIVADVPSDAGAGGSVGRALDALRLSLEVFLDAGLWSVVPVVAVVALGACLVTGDRLLAVFGGGVLVLVLLGGAWVTFAFAELPVTPDEATNPIVRYTGAAVLLAGALTPLLLAAVWRGRGEPAR